MTQSPRYRQCTPALWRGLCGRPLALASNEGLGITRAATCAVLRVVRTRMARCVWSLAYSHGCETMDEPGHESPTRHSQVSCYTNRRMMITSTRPSSMISFKVKLTTNVSLNMALSIQFGQALGAQTLTVRFAFAVGYVFWLGHPAPTRRLADGSWGSYSHDASPAAHLQVLAHDAAQRDDGGGCEFFGHTMEEEGVCVMPNVRGKAGPTA